MRRAREKGVGKTERGEDGDAFAFMLWYSSYRKCRDTRSSSRIAGREAAHCSRACRHRAVPARFSALRLSPTVEIGA